MAMISYNTESINDAVKAGINNLIDEFKKKAIDDAVNKFRAELEKAIPNVSLLVENQYNTAKLSVDVHFTLNME